MHAHVRWMLLRDDRWDGETWGQPINQHDLLATSLLFSIVFVDGIRQLGLHVTEAEAEDHLHLWRWASWLMGTRLELLPDRQENARRLAEVIELTQGPPDADSRRLVHQLLHGGRAAEAPPIFRALASESVGLCSPKVWARLSDFPTAAGSTWWVRCPSCSVRARWFAGRAPGGSRTASCSSAEPTGRLLPNEFPAIREPTSARPGSSEAQRRPDSRARGVGDNDHRGSVSAGVIPGQVVAIPVRCCRGPRPGDPT